MSEMIEKAAREVEDEYCLIYGKRCSTENARRLVLRTIAAMREPTEAMIKAGKETVGAAWDRDGWIEDDAGLTVWQAMIDAAPK